LPICWQLKNFTCLRIKRANCFKMSLQRGGSLGKWDCGDWKYFENKRKVERQRLPKLISIAHMCRLFRQPHFIYVAPPLFGTFFLLRGKQSFVWEILYINSISKQCHKSKHWIYFIFNYSVWNWVLWKNLTIILHIVNETEICASLNNLINLKII